jgi:DNA polymerase I-like protein with 3'-5' exonuclease and polymerase domains
MREIEVSAIPESLNQDQSLWLYNSLDCAVTLEVWEALQQYRTPTVNTSYNFVSAMRVPALAMMTKGIRIDMEQRAVAEQHYKNLYSKVHSILQKLSFAVWDKPLNPDSHKQVKDFFYRSMNIPEISSYKKGERKLSADRETLEKIEVYLHARPIVRAILACRDYEKKIQVLTKGLDYEQDHYRIRTSYNVVGTETGRWSSSEDAFGQGTNLQNITDELRRMFIPDPGHKFAYLDLEQAESRAVAYISGDANYIKACESGDLHTTVCQMIWSHIKTREQADEPFYRHLSYRDMAKKLGHGSNYYGQPKTMAKHAKIPVSVAEDFQHYYFAAFPGIRKWHKSVAAQLQVHGFITTALGRQRYFLGRRYDDTTLREAIAFEPQSLVGELLNLYLWRIWRHIPEVTPLAQIHDAVLIQYKKGIENEIIPKCLALANIPVVFNSGTLVIPSSAEVGFNWGKVKPENPLGLKKWKGNDTREEPRARGLLDRPIHTIL